MHSAIPDTRERSPLRPVLEAKKASLELERKKHIKISNGFAFLSGLLFIILFSNLYYFKNSILLNIPEPFFIAIPILLGLSLVMRSQRAEDQVFLKIMESLELLEKGPIDPEVRKHAAEKFEDATNRLERFIHKSRVSPLWYSKFRELEEDFVRKLKYRAVPALREGMLGSIRTDNTTVHMLEHIALVFIKQDTGQMKVVNDLLEGYDEIVTNEKSKLRSFYESRIGKPIVVLFSAYALLSVGTFIFALFTNQNFYGIISDPSFFILGGLLITGLILQFLRNE